MNVEKKVLGYALLPQDVDAYFFDRELMPELYCKICGARISNCRRQLPLRVGKRLKIGSTYDGVVLMSSEISNLVRGQSNAGMKQIHTTYGINYYFDNLDSVDVDLEFRPVEFANACSVCGVYSEVSHALPLRLVDDTCMSPFSVKRTSVQFGEGWLRAPIVIIGSGLYAALRSSNPSGLDVAEVFSASTGRWW